jgi:hypothetical protein
MTSFRLASNATFGIYSVFANIEIMGEVANDTLTFRVGWIIEVLSVETTDLDGVAKTTFAREKQICFNITVVNIAFTSKVVTFSVAIADAENVPIGQITLIDWIILSGTSVIFVMAIQIPQWAFTGLSMTYANAYTNLPSSGGVPYCPEVSRSFIIVP